MRLHEREAEPRVGAFDKLTEELEVDTRNVAFGAVYARIYHLEVVDFVGNEVGKVLVIEFGSELERTVE